MTLVITLGRNQVLVVEYLHCKYSIHGINAVLPDSVMYFKWNKGDSLCSVQLYCKVVLAQKFSCSEDNMPWIQFDENAIPIIFAQCSQFSGYHVCLFCCCWVFFSPLVLLWHSGFTDQHTYCRARLWVAYAIRIAFIRLTSDDVYNESIGFRLILQSVGRIRQVLRCDSCEE